MRSRSVLVLAALAAVLTAPAAPAQGVRAECLDGVAALPDVGAFPCKDVDLVGYLPRSAFAVGTSGAARHNDIWGWTDPETGTEYALVGTENGTAFVDLSDPLSPSVVGKLPTQNGLQSAWRDVKVYADHAFVVADASPDHGVQVFDLTRLRGLSGPPVVLQADVVYDGISAAHNIVIDEESGFAYAVGFLYFPEGRTSRGLPPACDEAGFHVIDVRDPSAPTFVTCFSDAASGGGSGYTHDAQCLVYNGPDSDYVGRQICVGANEDTVTIFDVTDKSSVQVVSLGFYPNRSYTHQGWFTADQRFFLVNDELDEANGGQTTQRTLVMDLTDLDAPEFAFAYDSGITSIDHNLYVRDGLAYESNYEAGLRIVDLRQVGNGTLEEVAFFDTFPSQTTISAPCLPPRQGNCGSFNGQWSNYPFFESGLVIANDRDLGLFVLRPDPALVVGRAGGPAAPVGYELTSPRPNPATGGARLALRVDQAQTVRADLFDVAGRRVAAVYEGPAGPGAEVTLSVSGDGLPAGVYVVRVVGETFEASRRVVLAR